MQQLNIHDYYDFGKEAESFSSKMALFTAAVDLSSIAWPLFTFRWRILSVLQEPCALLPSSQRAAKAVIQSITDVLPEDMQQVFNPENKAVQIEPYRLTWIRNALTNFETILKNDMPEMATFAVAQIGIYRTEDLIKRPELQIDDGVRGKLLPLAKSDVTEAGKCLAFRVPTAAAFHLSRAIETGMNQYYEALTGKPFQMKDAARNWGAKTDALVKAGADEKITEYLIHIRKAYRNPITHPDAILEPAEAFNFFPQALSVISMMLGAVKTIDDAAQPTLNFAEALGGLYGAIGTGDDIRPGDEENIKRIEGGVTEATGSGEES